jgi:polyisoprenoid-binding protein YceI
MTTRSGPDSAGQMTPPAAQVLRDGKAAGYWILDESRTEIRLKSKSMWGLAPVKGVFRQVSGGGTVSPSGDVTGTITVATRSIDTKHKGRDNHLRSRDFFDVDSYPAISVTVDKVTAAGDRLAVAGQLSVRGRTRPVSFDVSVSRFNGKEAHLDGELHVNRADFGLIWNRLGSTSMNNTITVHTVFTRSDGTGATEPLKLRSHPFQDAVGS